MKRGLASAAFAIASLLALDASAENALASPMPEMPPGQDGYGYGYRYPYGRRPLPPEHDAPRTSLWTGVRVGLEAPVGDSFEDLAGTRFTERNLVGAGPLGEVDVGGRFGRSFLPFLFFAHTFATRGNGSIPRGVENGFLMDVSPTASPTSSATNVLGFGFRYEFHPDDFGFAAEMAFGLRFTSTTWSDGTRLSAQAPGELRIGIGALIRTSKVFVVSPMVRLGAGTYSDVTESGSGTRDHNVAGPTTMHGYVGFDVGGHFDLFGKYD